MPRKSSNSGRPSGMGTGVRRAAGVVDPGKNRETSGRRTGAPDAIVRCPWVQFPFDCGRRCPAALPHATPTDRLSGEGDLLLVDWGADGGLYKSDLTRVLVTGKISPKLERVYRVVLSAQEQAIAAIRPGAIAQDVDAVARGVIEQAGFGRYFGHGLGHGLGLEVHEALG